MASFHRQQLHQLLPLSGPAWTSGRRRCLPEGVDEAEIRLKDVIHVETLLVQLASLAEYNGQLPAAALAYGADPSGVPGAPSVAA